MVKSKINKGGLSTVVTSLIMILLVLVAVGVIWIMIAKIISESTEEVFLGKFTIDTNIESVSIDEASNNVSVIVKRKPGMGEFSGIKFIFYNATNSEQHQRDVDLEELESKRFNFHLNNLNVSTLTKISIALIFKTSSGKESVGNIVDTYRYRGKSGGPDYCEPCDTGYVCNVEGVCVSMCNGNEGTNISINSDNVFCDNNGDMWSSTATNSMTWGPAVDNLNCSDHGGDSSYPACYYCFNLDYAGFNDWALPSCDSGTNDSGCQLRRFYDDACGGSGDCSEADLWDSNNHYSHGEAYYWSGTAHPFIVTSSYFVYMNFLVYDGYVGSSNKGNSFYVRCVRSYN